MAKHLVSIYGTEKDKVNCPFYYKIGACRHGTRCSRTHNKPLFSPTLLLENMYQSPDQIVASARAQCLSPPQIPRNDMDNHFDDFFLDVYGEMSRFGQIEQLHVCENLADHLAGNTYVKFLTEEACHAALVAMQGRWYAGRPVKAELSPVTDFEEGKCRPFERFGQCERGNYCHFMHLRKHAAISEVNFGSSGGWQRSRPGGRSGSRRAEGEFQSGWKQGSGERLPSSRGQDSAFGEDLAARRPSGKHWRNNPEEREPLDRGGPGISSRPKRESLSLENVCSRDMGGGRSMFLRDRERREF